MSLGGFLAGFNQRSGELRGESERQAAAERDRNTRVLSTLAGSDDPEISSMAVTALLSGAAEGKAGKGLSGFFGQIRQHPLFQTLTSLVNSPKATQLPTHPGISGPVGTAVNPDGTLPSASLAGVSGAGVVPQAPAGSGRAPRVSTQHGTTTAPGTAAVAAPPPAAQAPFGTPVGPAGSQAFEPRRVFYTPEEKAAAEASGTLTGRITGAAGAYQTLTGQPLPAADIADMTRGAMGAPRRIMASIPGTIVLPDGRQIAGSYDPETDRYSDAAGNPVPAAKEFIRGNPNTGQGQGGFRTTDAQGTVHVFDKDGNEIQTLPGAGKPQAPPPVFTGIVGTPSGSYGVTRGGAAVPLTIPKGVDPQVYAGQLDGQIRQIVSEAQARTPKLGGMGYDPDELAANLDTVAKAYGYPSYNALQRAYTDAVRGVGTGVPEPGAPPPAAQHPGKNVPAGGRGGTPTGPSGDIFGILGGAQGGRGGR